jgi:hypothetical protein
MLRLILLAAVISSWIGSGVIDPDGEVVPTQGAGGSTVWDTLTYVFVMDTTVTSGHYAAEYAADVAEADEVFELGTEVPFAYGYMRENNETGNYSDTRLRLGFQSQAPMWQIGDASDYLCVVRPDFGAALGTGGATTVVEANFKGVVVADMYGASDDTFSTTLMTDPDASSWYDADNLVVNPAGSYQYQAALSWNFQKFRRNAADGLSSRFPVETIGVDESRNPWPWANGNWTDRWIWDVGEYHTYSNAPPDSCDDPIGENVWNGCSGSQSFRTGNIMRYPMENAVQAIINGKTNNGIILAGNVFTAAQTKVFAIYNFEQDVNLSPWFTVKVATKAHAYRYGAPGIILWNTDDQRLANFDYADTLAAHTDDGKMTIYARQDNVGAALNLSFADLKTFVDAGHEVGSHTREHIPGTAPWGGLNYWFASGPVVATDWFSGAEYGADLDTTTTTTQWDMLLWDTDPDWLYDGLEAEGMDRAQLERNRNVAKTIATPLNQWNPAVLRAVEFHGYKGVRVGEVASKSPLYTATGIDPNLRQRKHWLNVCNRGDAGPTSTSALALAECDSLAIGLIESDPTKPTNLRGVPLTESTSAIVGDKNATPTEYEVRRNVRRLLTKLEATNNRVLNFYTHEFKLEGPYDGGMNRDEFSWFVSTADSMGWKFRTVSAFLDLEQNKAEAVDTPPAWGNVPKWTADDRVMFVPWGQNFPQ